MPRVIDMHSPRMMRCGVAAPDILLAKTHQGEVVITFSNMAAEDEGAREFLVGARAESHRSEVGPGLDSSRAIRQSTAPRRCDMASTLG